LINTQQSLHTLTLPTSDIKEDCDCKSFDMTHLAENIINKLGKNEVLSNLINSYIPQSNRPFCDLLSYLMEKNAENCEYYWKKCGETGDTIWYFYYYFLLSICVSKIYFYVGLWEKFCNGDPSLPLY